MNQLYEHLYKTIIKFIWKIKAILNIGKELKR